MDHRSTSRPSPEEAERRFTELLEDAGLPRFASSTYDPDRDALRFTWDHGLIVFLDLTDDEPGDLSLRDEPIHVTVPGSPDDPRDTTSLPGVVIHRGPPLHADDLTTVDGIPVTSPSRTLIDLAEDMGIDGLRAWFAEFRDLGLLDPEALRASRARVEWRPSLAMLDEVIAEFCG
jgi:hypothetical protein